MSTAILSNDFVTVCEMYNESHFGSDSEEHQIVKVLTWVEGHSHLSLNEHVHSVKQVFKGVGISLKNCLKSISKYSDADTKMTVFLSEYHICEDHFSSLGTQNMGPDK